MGLRGSKKKKSKSESSLDESVAALRRTVVDTEQLITNQRAEIQEYRRALNGHQLIQIQNQSDEIDRELNGEQLKQTKIRAEIQECRRALDEEGSFPNTFLSGDGHPSKDVEKKGGPPKPKLKEDSASRHTDQQSHMIVKDGINQNAGSSSFPLMVRWNETINKLYNQINEYTIEHVKPHSPSTISLEVRVNSAAAIEDLDSFKTSDDECIQDDKRSCDMSAGHSGELGTPSQLSIAAATGSSNDSKDEDYGDRRQYKVQSPVSSSESTSSSPELDCSSDGEVKVPAIETIQGSKEKGTKQIKLGKEVNPVACSVTQSFPPTVGTAGDTAVKPCVEQVIEDVADCIEGFKGWASPPKTIPMSRRRLFRTRATVLPRPVSPVEEKWSLVNKCKPVTVQPVNKTGSLDSPQKSNFQCQLLEKYPYTKDNKNEAICNSGGDTHQKNNPASSPQNPQRLESPDRNTFCSLESDPILHSEGDIHEKNHPRTSPKKVVQSKRVQSPEQSTFSSSESYPIVHDYIDRGEKGRRGPVLKKRNNISKKPVHPKHQSQKKNKRYPDESALSETDKSGSLVINAAGSTGIANNPSKTHASLIKAFHVKKKQ